MKLIALCGSPRKNQSTQWALEQALEAAEKEFPQLKSEIILLADKEISGCTACGACNKGFKCAIDDDFQEIQKKLKDPQVKGLLLGSPVYMGGMTAQLKAFLDRTVMFRRNGFALKDWIGGALTIGGSRNGGQDLTLQNIHASMMIHDMIIAGDGHNTAHFGGAGWARVEGGIKEDRIAIDTYKNLGKRMAELMKRIHSCT